MPPTIAPATIPAPTAGPQRRNCTVSTLDGAAFLIARPFTGAAEATPAVDTTLAAINAAAVSLEKSMMSPYRYVQTGADQTRSSWVISGRSGPTRKSYDKPPNPLRAIAI